MDIFGFDFDNKYNYENGFYITSDKSRMGKILAHYELYKMICDLPGDVVETGVFKGASLIRWLTFRDLLENENSRKVIGFDTFGHFPDTDFSQDKSYRQSFVDAAGEHSISIDELNQVLAQKKITNVDLVAGDINQTVPDYVTNNPHLKIALLHIDTDIYEPAITALEHFYPRIVKGGVVVLDDYASFPGETKAVDDFFKGKDVEIKKLRISHNIPAYILKKEF